MKKKSKGCKEDEVFLRNIIYKKFGSIAVTAFPLRLAKTPCELKETPYKANRIRALLSKMFTLAIRGAGDLIIPFMELKNIKNTNGIDG